MDKEFVSVETARLLQEKGYNGASVFYSDEDAFAWNRDNHIEEPNPDYNSEIPFDSETLIKPLPHITLSMAMRWLRKEHNLHIITLPYAPIDRHPYHPGEADIVYFAQVFKGIIPIDEIGRNITKLSPEEACDAAIKYCLENLV